MRLINTETLELAEFHGFHKIQRACQIAIEDGIEWIWIDTNCIDKRSSAELTEAINSMYNWYSASTVCYAYLCDVPDLDMTEEDPLHHFRKSSWFHRGWTLQELIAPSKVLFYSKTWTRIGDRSGSLAVVITRITGIDLSVIRGIANLHQISVAKRMSWAATRQTSRVEDMAYCLLGIFDVNMPLLYGEGPKAFIRLQEEIIRISNDHTIFCWARDSGAAQSWTSMLAPSPAAFLKSGDYVAMDAWEAPEPYSMTNLGLSIHLPVLYTLTQMVVVLDAGVSHGDPSMRACIAMQRTNQRRSGSNILDRSRLFGRPILLSKEATDTRERYRLIIRSRYISPVESPYRHLLPMFKHGVLLFVDPATTRLLSTSKHDMPLGAVGYDIDTHPAWIFDFDAGILRLPAFEGGSSLITSGLMRIRFKSPQAADFYLFFAVILTLGGKEVWNCRVHLAADLDDILLAFEEERGEDERPPDDLLIHQYLRVEAWQQHCQQLTAHSSDESWFVSIGGPISSLPGTNVRAAVLSAKADTHLPVPLQLIKSNSTDHKDDESVRDSGEDEDEYWDSEEKDEDDKEFSQLSYA
ncbi:hypothetical protein DL770_000816 [Monosporascus sp. CRB-9-2]|nr:hypothetical protein DL770_000816 [Monosporascus sp. CRB-9-2]